MTEKIPNIEFVKYRLTWKFTDDGDLQESAFYLPWGIEPSEYVGSILSVVELSASEYGYEYNLKIVECPNWTVDQEYFSQCFAGELEDCGYLVRVNSGVTECHDCLWVEDKDTCLYDEIHKGDSVDISRMKRMGRMDRIRFDEMWVRLQRRIRESSEPIKTKPEEYGHFGYTSEDGEDFENQEVDRMLREENAGESEALGDA